jgi:UDP-N-acetylglucosamine 2-epimerase (non-hydrolysing)
MREVTERMEGVEAGTAKLVGTSQELIVKEIQHLLDDPGEYQRMAQAHNPYGDGMASKRIVQFFLNRKD